jgi:hypothetical protein
VSAPCNCFICESGRGPCTPLPTPPPPREWAQESAAEVEERIRRQLELERWRTTEDADE